MSTEKSKKAIRRGNRAFVTKVIQTANDAIVKFGGTQVEKDILEGYKVTLMDKKESIKKLDEDIINEIEDEDKITEDIFQAGEVGESINRMIVRIDIVLKAVAVSNVPSQGLGTSVFSETQHIHPLPNKAKLPKLSLKKFTGNPIDWQSFYDSYTAAVHNNDTLSKVDKFNYLKTLLEGPAASAIAGFSLTEENYETALKPLKDRYANPQVIVSSHVDALLKLESVSNIHEISKVRNLYDTIETHIRSPANLEIPSESYGTILIPMILAKLPQEMQLLISRKVGKDNWKLDDLLREFRIELEARERCSLIHTTAEKKDTIRKTNEPYTSAALFTTGDTTPIQRCSYCGEQHLSSKCNIITDIAARRAILRRKGKCFACLKSGHIVRHCPSKFSCPKCGNNHHVSLCEGVKPKQNPPKPNQEQQPIQQGNQTFANVCTNNNVSVLLQTASAMVGNPNAPQQPKTKSRIVFDSCSQKSYISSRLRNSLGLETVSKQSLLVKTFGNEYPKLMSCDLVQVSITATDGLELYVNAFSVPVICSPISNQAVELAVKQYPHLRGLNLADNSSPSNEVDIDILIGADFYWNFVSNESRRGEQPGPVALLTRLGWVLSGPIDNYCEEVRSTTNFAATHVLRVDATAVQDVQNTNMTEQLKKYWDLESIGVRGDESSVYDKFAKEVRFNGERYEAKLLPFKEHLENLSIKKEKEQEAERDKQRNKALAAERQRLEAEATMREEKRKQRELQEIEKKQAMEKIMELKKISVGARALKNLTEQEIEEMDADDIMARQVEQLDREKREMQMKLKLQKKRDNEKVEKKKRGSLEKRRKEAEEKERQAKLDEIERKKREKELKEFFSSKRIKWLHMVELSPWWGGFYERLVRSVKRCLKKVLRTARLTYEELLTLLIQIEGVMNSRPLTYLYEDNDQPLTPSHLVLGRRLLTPEKIVHSDLSEEVDSSQKTSRRQKYLRTVLVHFWKRWQREYLTQLREYHRPRERKGQTVKKGDVVVIQEDNVKRLNWNIGRVKELLKGRDGNTRAVVLRTVSKGGEVILLNRPIQKLYPLELRSESEDQEVPLTFVEHGLQEN